MLLKYLEIQGFKSFPDKTKVTFGKGLTAVVGPNGSGKSNISDAVRWVMGEQSTKTLRGSKMEDVIFAGTKTRKSQGFAEVSLTVDNMARELDIDSDEVTITRRYDRSGDSEYMINRSAVRLKDLQEILMDTGLGKDGYSLVGQGKIAEIVQSKSNERREIFEEAAGISKFRYRKNESQRSLERAEENLVRLRDILSELESRVAPLKEQSEKAKKFLTLTEEKKSLEVSIWIDTLERSNQVLKDQGDKILACNVQHEEIENQIQEIENQIQSAFANMQNCLVSGENMRKEKGEVESTISQITAQIAVCENNIVHNKQNMARIQAEMENHAKSADVAEEEIKAKQQEIETTKQKLCMFTEETEKKQKELLQKSAESENFSQRERELADWVNKLLLEESQVKMTISSTESNLAELVQTIEKNRVDTTAKVQQRDDYTRELGEVQVFMTQLEEKAQSLGNTYAGHKIKLENRLQKLQQMRQDYDKSALQIKEKEQRVKLLEGMEQSLDGFAFSVKEVIKKAKNGALKGISGTVSQLIAVADDYATAIETALGGAMQHVIVDSETDAKAAIRLLKQESLGRATFLPITSVSGGLLQVDGLERYGGYVDLAANLVTCDNKYKSITNSLLGRVVIVDDIDTATLIAQKNGYKFRIVTLDGQVVNAGGSFTGGSKNKGQSFLSRKNEIVAMQQEITLLKQKLQQTQSQMEQTTAETAKIEAEFTAISSEMTTLNEDKIRVEGEQKRLNQLLLQTTQLVAAMSSELNEKTAREKLFVKNKQDMATRLSLLKEDISKNTQELDTLQASSQSATGIKTQLADEITQLNIQGVTLQKDIEAIESAIIELERRKQNTDDLTEKLVEEQNLLSTENDVTEEKIQQLKQTIAEKQQEIQLLQDKIEETIAKRQQLEGQTTSLRKDERSIAEQKEKLASEMARLEEKKSQIQKDYDEIIAKLWNEYELTRSEGQKLAVKLENISKATAELGTVRSRIRALGSVNVDAIEEYKAVSERYEFLNGQVQDAEKSRNELLRLIYELTQKMQDIFAENFEKINQHFQKIFVDLFGGGSAKLTLTDPENLLESGIDIFVEPPGKIIRNLAALSGGEQAFVAIAIYFAILKVRPAPFCILDEIEAALDDVNVDKYASYLRSMSDNTQFIMITHRRGSMEAADVLYGVTMQDEGVSKLLELNVSEIENKLNLKL